ncbi:MAG: glycosyltransferase [Coriobacteriales bacterium]|nr:glycosyltransferase [Coriobacteriales bacterium]
MGAEVQSQPLVSVVTVCLNAEAHIGRAMRSVLDQTYSRIEYVVVDGQSTDGTLGVVEEFAGRFGARLKWISEPDKGLYDAMNKGVAMATGELVGILNADDYYEPDAVERAVATWRANPSAGVVYGDDRTFAADGTTKLRPTRAEITLADMRRDHIVHHHASFVTRGTYDRVGAYDISHPIAADYDFFLRCLEAGVEFARVDGVITNFSLEGVSHHNIRRTDYDATTVRIAHGASPIAAWARYHKRRVALWIYNRLKGSAAFRHAYERYRAMMSR